MNTHKINYQQANVMANKFFHLNRSSIAVKCMYTCLKGIQDNLKYIDL